MGIRNHPGAATRTAPPPLDMPVGYDQVSDLIGSIYDCALDPTRWEAAVRGICRQFAYDVGMMSVLRFLTGVSTMQVAVGVTPEWAARSAKAQDDVIDAWGGPERVMAYPLDEPVIASRIAGPEALAGKRYLREWAHPQGIRDAIAVAIARAPAMLGNIAFSRREPAEALGDREIEQLRLIAPHIRRAVMIGDLFDMKAIEASTFASLVDGFAFGLVLVDAELDVVHANPAAQAMMRAYQPLRAEKGKFVLPIPASQNALERAVRQAANDAARLGGRGIGIPMMGSGGPAVIHVLPLRIGRVEHQVGPRAVAALFIAAAGPALNIPYDALAAIYDLTPAETRIFELIAASRTQAEISEALGIATNTVKFHIRNLFAKTGCHRGTDLSRLAASLAGPA
jgi:DNA-binding CsgD family transcriptional regulator